MIVRNVKTKIFFTGKVSIKIHYLGLSRNALRLTPKAKSYGTNKLPAIEKKIIVHEVRNQQTYFAQEKPQVQILRFLR